MPVVHSMLPRKKYGSDRQVVTDSQYFVSRRTIDRTENDDNCYIGHCTFAHNS